MMASTYTLAVTLVAPVNVIWTEPAIPLGTESTAGLTPSTEPTTRYSTVARDCALSCGSKSQRAMQCKQTITAFVAASESRWSLEPISVERRREGGTTHQSV